MGILLDMVVKGKAGKFGSRGGGCPPKAPGVKWDPKSRCRVSPASAILVEELLVTFTDTAGGVVGTLGLALRGDSDFSTDPSLLGRAPMLMSILPSISFFAASCLMYSSWSEGFKGGTKGSPVFSYSSKFNLVEGGLLKL